MRIDWYAIVFCIALCALFSSSGCGISYEDNVENRSNNVDTASPEDAITINSNGLMAGASTEELINHSDAVVIGTVSKILAPKWCESLIEGNKSICTDVIITIDRYLYGQPQTELIAVRIYGGQIDNTTVNVPEIMVSFDTGEEVLLLLERPSELFSNTPSGIDPASYFWVTGFAKGKFTVVDNRLVDWQNNTIPLSEIEQKVEQLHQLN